MKSVSTYCPWHASVVVITVIATACLVSFIAAAVTYQLQIGLIVPFLILLAILVLAILVSVGMTPLKVKVSDEGCMCGCSSGVCIFPRTRWCLSRITRTGLAPCACSARGISTATRGRSAAKSAASTSRW